MRHFLKLVSGLRAAQPRSSCFFEAIGRRRNFAAIFVICLGGHDLSAQSVTGGTQTYASLNNATVTMSGRSEVRVTGATPLTGSTVSLNSPDAFLILTSVRPSAVVATYLGQIKVNGADAVASGDGTNVRVVEYGLGTIIVAQPPTFQPLQAFTGPGFTGTAQSFSPVTYYTRTGVGPGGVTLPVATLGAMSKAMSSFKLKRGYMATIATTVTGLGASKVYVAQDGDLEVGALPATLDNAVQFIRVMPWHWVGKKGACDIPPDTLNVTWWYNWNNTNESTFDREYVPIRQQPFWPGFPTNRTTVTHLLGFNEPNGSDQDAYKNLTPPGSVDSAVSYAPQFLPYGLRIGSPAVTDGGTAWITNYVNQVDAAGQRLDFVPIHYYRASSNDAASAATGLYSFLKAVHDATGRPIWITEFNNGANWTTGTDPTLAQNRDCIEAMINMMDQTPWIERYAVYSAVEAVRQMTDSTGALTPAGTMYRDHVAPLSYVQDVPATGGRGMVRLPLDGDARDASGFANHGLAANTPGYVAGQRGQAVQFNGTNQFLQLPAGVARSTSFSFTAWVNWAGGSASQRIFDFGALVDPRETNLKYLYLSPNVNGFLQFGARNGTAATQTLTATALTPNTWTHVAVTVSGTTATLFVNGVSASTGTITTPELSATPNNYLGRSQWASDPFFTGAMDEVHVFDYALTPAQVAALKDGQAPQFAQATIDGGTAIQGAPFAGSLSATDPDGDVLTYGKASGPAWLQVNPTTGALSGTPVYSASGGAEFVLTATDPAGNTASVVYTLSLNGAWISDADGLWSGATNWAGGTPTEGAGSIADFGTINITADRTVTLDTSRTVGGLVFGDTTGAQNWTLAAAGGSSLTLASGSSNPPEIAVTQTSVAATISAPLASANGLVKTGAGTLILAGSNSITGTLYIAASSGLDNDGSLRLANSGAISGVTAITIRSNNGGSSTLELDGTAAGISTNAPITLPGRNNTVAALRNVAGDNTVGALTVSLGGSGYQFQSDAGTLTFGAVTSSATGARVLNLSGNGSFNFPAVISNGSATTGLSLVKNGTGTLTLNAANTFTGGVTINGGTAVAGTNTALGAAGSPLTFGTAAASLQVNGKTLSVGALTGGSASVSIENASATAGALTVTSSTDATFPGAIRSTPGALAFTKGGAGILTLTGTNTFSGPVAINGGAALKVASLNSVSNGVASSNLGRPTTIAEGIISLGGSSSSGTLIYSGAGETTDRVINIGSGTSSALAIEQAGTGWLKFTSNFTATGGTTHVLTLKGSSNGIGEIAGAIVQNSSTNITGVVKEGSGAWILSGANTYTGSTTINAGLLGLGGTLASGSAVTVASGAALAGLGGTVAGPVTFASGSQLGWVLNGNAGSGGLTTGPVTVGEGATIRLVFDLPGSTVDFTNAYWSQPHSWPLLSSSSLSGAAFRLAAIGKDPAGHFYGNYGFFGVQQTATGVTLAFMPRNGGAPPAPTGLSAVVSPTRVALTWQLTGGLFDVLRSTSPGGPYTVIASDVEGTAFVDETVAPGTVYYYTVTAVNGDDESAPSAEVIATPHNPSTFDKADNQTALHQNASWAGFTIPDARDKARWAGLTGANSVLLGSDTSWNGIIVAATGGAVSIGAGQTLTLGAGGIDLSAATQDLSISSGLVLGAGNQAWTIAAGRVLTLNTGAFTRTPGATLNLLGSGTIAFSMTGLANTNGVIPWAAAGTGSGTRFATLSGGNLTAYTGATVNANWTSAMATATTNYDVTTGSSTIFGAASRTANTVRFLGAADTLTLGNAGSGAQLVTNGLINAGTGALTLATTSEVVAAGLAAGTANEIVLNAANAAITVSARVHDGATGTSSIAIVAPNAVTLSGANDYTGMTFVNNGTLVAGSATALGATAAGTVVVNGAVLDLRAALGAETLTIGGTGIGGAGALITGTGTGALSGAVTLTAATTVGGGGTLALSGAIGDGGLGFSLTKVGAGTVTLSGTNTYTGDVHVDAGILLAGNDRALGAAANKLRLNGAMFGKAGTAVVTVAHDIVLTGDTTIGWAASSTNNNSLTLSGSLTGRGTLRNFVGGTVDANIYFTGDLSGFTGTIEHTNRSGSDAQWWRFGSGNATPTVTDLSEATVVLKIGNVTNPNAFGKNFGFRDGTTSATLKIGALSGDGVFQAAYNNVGPNTLEVGHLNTDTTFSGVLAGGNAGTKLALVKVGTGTLTLSGVNLYTGATTINAGALSVTGSIGSGAVTVASGATLMGTGPVGGAVTVQSGGTLSPGVNAIGSLACASSVTMQTGAIVSMQIDKTTGARDALNVSGTLALGGELVVSNLSGTLAAGDTFTLFQAGSITGNFASVTLPQPGPGLMWDTGALSSGVITVVTATANATYTGWSAPYALPIGKEGMADDPDHDGIANGFEWIFGGDPLVGNIDLQPVVSLVSGAALPGMDAAESYLTLTARVRKSVSGVTLVAQAAGSLSALDDAGSSTAISSFQVNDLGEFETRTWIYLQPSRPSARAFMRLKITTE